MASEVTNAEWPIVPISDVVYFQEGPGLRNWQYRDAGIPFVNIRCLKDGRLLRDEMNCLDPKEVAEKYKHFLLEAGDYVVSSSGTLGRIAEVFNEDLPCMLNTSVIRFRPLDASRLDRRFLKAFLRSELFNEQILAFANGSAQLNYGPTHLKQMTMPLPPINEQRMLGEIMGALDNRIDLIRQANTTLEAIAQALFKSWFVDFDPVHAKSEGRDPEAMDAATAALFPSKFEQSELGLIPKGWRTASFDEVATRSKDTVNPLHKPDTQFEHYSLPAFDTGQLPIQEQGGAIKSNKTLVPPDAVLVSKLNPHIPRIWAVGQVGANAVCSTEFLVWMPKAPATSAFVYCLASSRSFNSAMRQLVTGTSNSHQRVKPAQLGGIRVCAVSDRAMEAFASAADPLLQKILHNRQQAATLASLRDTLLPRLISGKLRVPKAMETIKEVSA